MAEQSQPVITVVLGAGASRVVSYADGEGCSGDDLGPSMPSPLDRDFFDLLQQLEVHTKEGEVKEAMRRIIARVVGWKGGPLWQSMEKLFYSLHVSSVLQHKLFQADQPPDLARDLVNDFLASLRALLHEAHGIRACCKHYNLLGHLSQMDAVVTFNYDFVVEMALASRYGKESFQDIVFGSWFYGLSERPETHPTDPPTLYKLHGSLNWTLAEDKKGETQNVRNKWPATWADFAKELSYRPLNIKGYDHRKPRRRPPILLPYWDKRVEGGVWLKLWKAAAEQLVQTTALIIWGYSLPVTDLKARELFQLAFSSRNAKLVRVAVIDPSVETQDRWRRMFLNKPFLRFPSFDEFEKYTERQHAGLRDWLTVTNRRM